MNDDLVGETVLGSGEALARELMERVARVLTVPEPAYERLLAEFKELLDFGAMPGGVLDAKELNALAASVASMSRYLQRRERGNEIVSTAKARGKT